MANHSRVLLAAAILGALSAGALPANAGIGFIVYSTGFNAPTYTDGPLVGTSPQDSWVNTSAAGTNTITVANTATNGSVTLATSGEDDRRLFSQTLTSGSAYLSADITVNSAQTGDYFIHLGDGSTSLFYDRFFVKSTGANTFAIALGTSSGTPAAGAYGANLNIGTTYHFVAEYDLVPGLANDTGAVYINPTDPIFGDTPSSPSFYMAAVNQGTDATSIGAVYLRQGSATLAPVVTVDNIAVAFTPEPASLSLLGLGAVFMLRRRK